jgi:hypothetical protein
MGASKFTEGDLVEIVGYPSTEYNGVTGVLHPVGTLPSSPYLQVLASDEDAKRLWPKGDPWGDGLIPVLPEEIRKVEV